MIETSLGITLEINEEGRLVPLPGQDPKKVALVMAFVKPLEEGKVSAFVDPVTESI